VSISQDVRRQLDITSDFLDENVRSRMTGVFEAFVSSQKLLTFISVFPAIEHGSLVMLCEMTS
jgi:hypothetical protein